MRIVNKNKQAKSEDKRLAGRLIRRAPIDDIQVRKMPKRHNQNVCPVCGAPIEKTASGGRRKHSCSTCGATLNKRITCVSCHTNRIWEGRRGAACQGCGAKYQG